MGAVFYRLSSESLVAWIQMWRGCEVEKRGHSWGRLMRVNGPTGGGWCWMHLSP